MSRQTKAIIHADAILSNYAALRQLAPCSKTMAVIKADAYGHGAVNVARILSNHAPLFAVAIMEEAVALRDAGIRTPIVVLEGPHQAKECALAAELNCILVMHYHQQLQWAKQAERAQRPTIWIKVDSGMHRLGFELERVLPTLEEFSSLITPDSALVTHLACADDTESAFTEQQLAAFFAVAHKTGLRVSIANSPATVGWPASLGDWNRIGVALYGGGPLPETAPTLQPAMTLTAAIMALRQVKKGESVGYGQTWRAGRDSLIATVSIGYADGYPRHCPNGTPVVVNGQRASLAGRVSMDMITIDVTDIPDVRHNDPVELWGAQVSIDEIAAHAGTISYELMARVSARVPRIVRYQ